MGADDSSAIGELQKPVSGSAFEEEEVSEAEEEWPSVGLDLTEKAEGVTAAGGMLQRRKRLVKLRRSGRVWIGSNGES